MNAPATLDPVRTDVLDVARRTVDDLAPTVDYAQVFVGGPSS